MYSGRVSSSCSYSGTYRVTLVKNSMIRHQGGNEDGSMTTDKRNMSVVIGDTDIW
jgi:hypothetical protein